MLVDSPVRSLLLLGSLTIGGLGRWKPGNSRQQQCRVVLPPFYGRRKPSWTSGRVVIWQPTMGQPTEESDSQRFDHP